LDTLPFAFTPHHLPLAPLGYRLRVLYDDSIITSKWYNILVKLKHDNSLRDYIMKKTHWTLQQFEQVDWDAHQQAFLHQMQHQQISTAKVIHNLSNTNRQNHLFYQATSLCPLCQAQEETFEHV